MSRLARDAIESATANNFVSAVTAWEYVDLQGRGRLPAEADFSRVCDQLGAAVLDYPSDAWRLAATFPGLHGDPVDRMLIAHAIHADLTLVTADRTIHRYPVRTLW